MSAANPVASEISVEATGSTRWAEPLMDSYADEAASVIVLVMNVDVCEIKSVEGGVGGNQRKNDVPSKTLHYALREWLLS